MRKFIFSITLSLSFFFATIAHALYDSYEYDENGKLTTETTYNSNGTILRQTTYNSDGYPSSFIEMLDNGTYNYNFVYTYSTNEDGTVIGTGTSLAKNKMEAIRYMEYDSKGNLTRMTLCYSNGQRYESRVYTYDDNNNKTSYTRYGLTDKDMKFSQTYEYDSYGNCTKYGDYEYTNEYDNEGRLTKKTVSNGRIYKYTYDGNTTKETVYDSNGRYISSHKYTKQYDEYGNLIAEYQGSLLTAQYSYADPDYKSKQTALNDTAELKKIYTLEEAYNATKKGNVNSFSIWYK